MHGRGQPVGLLGHMVAAVALALAGMFVGWILAGGEPFGRIVASPDVSAPTRAAPPGILDGVEVPAGAATRLVADPPARERAQRKERARPKRRAVRRKRPARAAAPPPAVAQPPVVAVATAVPTPAAAPPPPVAAPPPASRGERPKRRRAERSRPAPGAGAGEG